MSDFQALADRLRGSAFVEARQALMQKIVFIALAKSQKRTPWRFGHLRRSETTRIEERGLRGFLGSNVRYAPFVHDGTKRMRGRPFFAQGIADSRAQIDKALVDAGDAFFRQVAT